MIKKIIIIIAVLFLFSTAAIADSKVYAIQSGPWLYTDVAYPDIVGFALIVNGVEVDSPAQFDSKGHGWLKYDLKDLPIGNNEIIVRSYNNKGELSPTYVTFRCVKPEIVPVQLKELK